MPTYERLPRFDSDYKKLDAKAKQAFLVAVRQFVSDLDSGGSFTPRLRVKAVQRTERVFEMTWAADGRATWMFGRSIVEAEPHVIWRRIGSHDIFKEP
jgi:hypothetical protein